MVRDSLNVFVIDLPFTSQRLKLSVVRFVGDGHMHVVPAVAASLVTADRATGAIEAWSGNYGAGIAARAVADTGESSACASSTRPWLLNTLNNVSNPGQRPQSCELPIT